MLEPLVTLVRTADRLSIDPGLPVVLAGVPRKLGVDVAAIYTKVMSRSNGSDAEVLRDAVRVLRSLGIDFGYLGSDEPCCGAPLYHMGLQKEFAANAGKAYAKLKSRGVKKVIGIVPSCTHALRSLFTACIPGYDIEVRHFIEVVAEKIKPGQFKYPRKVKIAYHDPCQLGRYMGILDQPRQALKAVENVELVEPEWTAGEWSTCCGGGGGFEVVFPDICAIRNRGVHPYKCASADRAMAGDYNMTGQKTEITYLAVVSDMISAPEHSTVTNRDERLYGVVFEDKNVVA
jgi:Fe-S oxidoreductase